MTRAESILASRLLDEAARHFHEHSCTDMDAEYFEGLSEDELTDLVTGYNLWRRREFEEGPSTLPHIGNDQWMEYLAAVIGRHDGEKATG